MKYEQQIFFILMDYVIIEQIIKRVFSMIYISEKMT